MWIYYLHVFHVCIYICKCIIYIIYIYIYIYIYTYIYMYIHMNIYTSIYVNLCKFIIYMYIRAQRILKRASTTLHVYIHMYIHIYTCIKYDGFDYVSICKCSICMYITRMCHIICIYILVYIWVYIRVLYIIKRANTSPYDKPKQILLFGWCSHYIQIIYNKTMIQKEIYIYLCKCIIYMYVRAQRILERAYTTLHVYIHMYIYIYTWDHIHQNHNTERQ